MENANNCAYITVYIYMYMYIMYTYMYIYIMYMYILLHNKYDVNAGTSTHLRDL